MLCVWGFFAVCDCVNYIHVNQVVCCKLASGYDLYSFSHVVL